ncbi:MAG: tetratricopeptide repeat protein [Thermoanaerobaculia bacterium]
MAIQRDKIVASAEKLVGKGKIESAIKEYERLLDDNPNDVNTLNRIGDLWVRVNRTDEAVKVYTRIADHYAKDGFFLKAIAIFKKINKLDPSRLEIYGRLADLYAKQGLAMEAKSQYQVLADYYMKHGDPDKALATFQKIAELDPNSINVHVKLADLYSQNNRTAEALKEYDRVGRMLLKRGMTEEAVQVFRKALKIDPGNIELAESLANTLIEAKDYANARSILEGARESKPDNPKLDALLGRVHIAQGNLGDAEKLLSESLAQHPSEPQLAELLADLFLRRGHTAGALNILEPIVDAAAARNDRTAVELLQRISRVDAAHIPTLEKLVSVYEKLNEETKILSSMNSLAEAHISAGDFEQAASVLERLIRREPENAQHREKLAFVRESLGGGDSATPAAEPDAEISHPDSLTPDFEAMMPPPLPPPPAIEEPSLGRVADQDEEDIDYITEQLTEAEVFAKYGLTEKALEHLQSVLDRSPRNIQAHDKLLHILMDEGAAARVGEVAARYLPILRDSGDLEALETVREELVSRGFSVDALDSTPESAPVSDAEAESVSALETVAAEDEIELGIDEEISFETDLDEPELLAPDATEVEVEAAAPEPVVEDEVDIDFDLTPEPSLADETAIEVELEEVSEADEEGRLDLTPESPSPDEPGIEVEGVSAPLEEGRLDFDLEMPAAVESPQPGAEDIEIDFEDAAIEVESEPEQPSPAAEAAAPADDVEVPFDEVETTTEAVSLDFTDLTAEEPETALQPEDTADSVELAEPAAEEVLELDQESGGAIDLDFDEPVPEPTEPAVEALGEIDFYLEQELFSDAGDRIANLEMRFPGNEEVTRRRTELERLQGEASARAAATIEPEPEETPDLLMELREEVEQDSLSPVAATDDAGLFADEDDFFDLAAELESELADEEMPLSITEEEQSLEHIFKEFKRGVEQQLDAEDYDTHYNLGIAYKEMELIDEAIGEFQLAAKDPKRMIECCSMLGLCFLEKGMPQLAIKWYQKGLEAPEITDDEHLGLLYDLGSAYLEVGDTPNAQKAFLEVYGIKSNYRDIVERIKQLEDVARQ